MTSSDSLSSTLNFDQQSPLYQRQVELEKRGVALGTIRYDKNNSEAADTLPGRRLVRSFVEPLEAAIVAFIEEAGNGKAGRKHSALQYIAKADPREVAFLTVRTAINMAGDNEVLQKAALSVATALEQHINYSRVADESPGLYHKVSEQLKTATTGHHRTAVFNKVVEKYLSKPCSWSQKERLLLGTKLIELFIDTCGLVEIRRVTRSSSADTPLELIFAEGVAERLAAANLRCAEMQPVHLPMVHPPRDWTSTAEGGYLTDLLHPQLVRTRSRQYMEEIGQVDLTQVIDAVNKIQKTPWRINNQVYSVADYLFTNMVVTKGLPMFHKLPLPPRPHGISVDLKTSEMTAMQQEEMKTWKGKAAKVHAANYSNGKAVTRCKRQLDVAAEFHAETTIYFPHYLDFRGRVYPLASYLNPQSDELGKSLLEFAEGKPLGKRGVYWLAVHIANLFGVDKVSFDDRVKWTHEHSEQILDSAREPLDGEQFWQTADDPFCALAACFDWLGYKTNGEGHISHLPIAMDGSCSGLQHFSALLLDEQGGAAVNLLPCVKPADVYTKVAEHAQGLSDVSDSEYASSWMGKFNRKVSKHPTMTLCYSATKSGMVKMIDKALGKIDDDLPPGQRHLQDSPFDNTNCSRYAAGMIWDALGEVVVAARQGMDFLQAVAGVTAEANMPLRWTSPLGLPVVQAYRRVEGQRVACFVDGVKIEMTLTVDTDDISKPRQKSAVAPNFIHCMDSSHLMSTALLGHQRGITHLAVIHDSFGTHACDTDMLHAVIRDAFVEQYSVNRLELFRAEVVAQLEAVAPELVEKLPPVPPTGNLDLSKVRESLYLFA